MSMFIDFFSFIRVIQNGFFIKSPRIIFKNVWIQYLTLFVQGVPPGTDP